MKRQNGTKNKTQQKQEENGSETQHYHLVDWDDAPKYMQINPFIKHGYRPRFSPKLILQSLFRLHNETWNIWTHIFAVSVFIFFFYHSLSWPLFIKESKFFMEFIEKYFAGNVVAKDYMPMMHYFFVHLFGLGCVVTFLLSGIYHLGNCHSEKTMRILQRLDFSGITLTIITATLAGVLLSLGCNPWLKYKNLIIISLFVAICFSLLFIPKFSTPQYARARLFTFVTMALYGIVPLFEWIYINGIDSEEVAIYGFKMFIAYLILMFGAMFYVTKFPERYFPGHFTSFWLQSHTLWHIFIFLGCLYLYYLCWDYLIFTQLVIDNCY